jgi:hypothetical protein
MLSIFKAALKSLLFQGFFCEKKPVCSIILIGYPADCFFERKCIKDNHDLNFVWIHSAQE